MRKAGLVIAIATAAFFLLSGVASANFGPHGGYLTDTDACAGCHRAHTAVSGITWADTQGGYRNALLIGTTASTLREFCYTCHGEAGAGAATNVQSGVYDNSTARVGTSWPATYNYTNSAYLGVLNGGGFEDMGGVLPPGSMTSWHEVQGGTAGGGVAWGGGTTGYESGAPTGGTTMLMDCASCHDPHGSSNYRILKDYVNGVQVGGYQGGIDSGPNPDPQPFVVSNEEGYPAGDDLTTLPVEDLGFKLHTQYPSYKPDYTTARYARAPNVAYDFTLPSVPVPNGMSGWCAACHTQYNWQSASGQGAYNAADGYGYVTRHRHPVNWPLSAWYGVGGLPIGDRSLILPPADYAGYHPSRYGTNTPWEAPGLTIANAVDIPLEHDPLEGDTTDATDSNRLDGRGNKQDQSTADWMGCLTCHRAHGTNATMDGYANSKLFPTVGGGLSPQPNSGGTTPTSKGVPPAGTSVLLRANNRGVCERCHNK